MVTVFGILADSSTEMVLTQSSWRRDPSIVDICEIFAMFAALRVRFTLSLKLIFDHDTILSKSWIVLPMDDWAAGVSAVILIILK